MMNKIKTSRTQGHIRYSDQFKKEAIDLYIKNKSLRLTARILSRRYLFPVHETYISKIMIESGIKKRRFGRKGSSMYDAQLID